MDSHAISSIWGNSSSDALRPTTSTSSGRNTPSRRFLNGSHLNPLNNQSPLLGWNLSGSAATNPSTPTRPVAPPPGLGFSNSHPPKPPVDVPDMMRRFQSLKSHEYSKDALIEELLDALSVQSEQRPHDDCETQRWRALAEKLSQEKDVVLQENHRLKARHANRDPYVLALIDGDALLFDETLIAKGEQGGVEAVEALKQKLHNYCTDCLQDVSRDALVVTRVYANAISLGKVLSHLGLIDDASSFEQFVKGFNRQDSFCDYIGAGFGQENFDGKIADILKLHLSDDHCQQIFFGCSDSQIYAELLEDCAEDDASIQRITLLESTPFAKRIRQLPFATTSLSDLFISAQSLKKMPSSSHLNPPSPLSSVSMSRGSSMQSSQKPETRPPSSDATSHPDSRAPSPGARPSPVSATSWATVTSKSKKPAVPTEIHLALAPRREPLSPLPAARDSIPRNRRGQRIDPVIKHDKDEVDRVKKLKICNFHYLCGACPNPSCSHRHDYKPTAKEVHYLALVARMAPCRFGSDCDDPKCIYGHVCPAPEGRNGELCIFAGNCRFPPEMHKIDRTVVKVVKV